MRRRAKGVRRLCALYALHTKMELTITTCQASIAAFFVCEVAGYLGHRLGLATRFINEIAWQERQAQLDANQIDVGWICGAPYVRRIDQQLAAIELLAAPVMAASRYQDQPVYFSDVVVRYDSPYQKFADLRGTRWAYNERKSYSGYEVVRSYLATQNLDRFFFGQVIESGAHQRSVELILRGDVEASAIDSTVLDLLYAQQPQLCHQLRAIDTLGPSPIPPWVIGLHVAPELRIQLREALIQMQHDPVGQAILLRGQTVRFATVGDADYDLTRTRLAHAEAISL